MRRGDGHFRNRARNARLRTGAIAIASCAIAALLLVACRGVDDVPCDQVPTTADGCREVCHDRGVEMTFFRYAPGTYRCDAICTCADTTIR